MTPEGSKTISRWILKTADIKSIIRVTPNPPYGCGNTIPPGMVSKGSNGQGHRSSLALFRGGILSADCADKEGKAVRR